MNDYTNFDNKKIGIANKFISNQGLFEQIFGDKSVAMYNLEKERLKNILVTVYGFSDIEEVFPPEIDIEKINNSMKTMFRFNTQEQLQDADLEDIGL